MSGRTGARPIKSGSGRFDENKPWDGRKAEGRKLLTQAARLERRVKNRARRRAQLPHRMYRKKHGRPS